MRDHTHDEHALDEHALDGNAVAGLLAEIFGSDMTVADCQCAACGRRDQLGGARAYVNAPGVVLRCAACGAVMIRVVDTPRGRLVEARGLAFIRLQQQHAGVTDQEAPATQR